MPFQLAQFFARMTAGHVPQRRDAASGALAPRVAPTEDGRQATPAIPAQPPLDNRMGPSEPRRNVLDQPAASAPRPARQIVESAAPMGPVDSAREPGLLDKSAASRPAAERNIEPAVDRAVMFGDFTVRPAHPRREAPTAEAYRGEVPRASPGAPEPMMSANSPPEIPSPSMHRPPIGPSAPSTLEPPRVTWPDPRGLPSARALRGASPPKAFAAPIAVDLQSDAPGERLRGLLPNDRAALHPPIPATRDSPLAATTRLGDDLGRQLLEDARQIRELLGSIRDLVAGQPRSTSTFAPP
jgi:hypothetical protein